VSADPIRADDPFRAPARISLATWVAVWERAGYPATLFGGLNREEARRLAGRWYGLIVAAGHDPAMWLAIAGREHGWGRAEESVLRRCDTRSLTNARSVRLPGLTQAPAQYGPDGRPVPVELGAAEYQLVRDPVRGSTYVRYPSAEVSLLDGMYRIDDPSYRYQREGRRTIAEVFAIWTEDPGQYAAWVVEQVNVWRRTEGRMFELPDAIDGVPVRRAFIPAGNSNRPGLPVLASGAGWITVHETGNPNPGANAEMHRAFVHGRDGVGGGGYPATAGKPAYEGVSFHLVVDDREIVWLLPLEERAWHAGDGADGPGNSSTAIETCINSDGDWARTQEHLARLVAWLARNHPAKSVERIAQHHQWARDGKNCPARLRANGGAGWAALLERVRALAEPALWFSYPDGTRCPHPVIAGFRGWLEAMGRARGVDDLHAAMLSVAGYPLEAEWRGADGCTYQQFERLVLQWTPGQAPPWDIVVLPRGASLPARAG
jgi:N-acetylmuramoyl-L-alanine amidase